MEVEAFVVDRSAEAWDKVVDRLLGSLAFGEKWGRQWLDVARYAESTCKTVNFNYPACVALPGLCDCRLRHGQTV